MNIATGGLKTLLVTFGDTGSVRGALGGGGGGMSRAAIYDISNRVL